MAKTTWKLDPAPKQPSKKILDSVIERIHSHVMTMIHLANHRKDKEKGDPKVGGHPAACASSVHIQSALHLCVKNPQDYIAIKPHASPVDHTNNYFLKLFFEKLDGEKIEWMQPERMAQAMKNLRHFSHSKEPVFQSYHSAFDPDHWNTIPSGSVGIPPVKSIYLAHAYRMARSHGYPVPEDAHFWSIMGDSEFREGSLSEAMPEAAERNLGNVTWILDYNRQSLDGHRVLNEEGLGGKDNDRITGTLRANGWEVIELRHGSFREKIFSSKNGDALRSVFEEALPDFELQALLAAQDATKVVESVSNYDKTAAKALTELKAADVLKFLNDLGGHDIEKVIEALKASKENPDKPCFVLVHTLKGWNLNSAAKSANHNTMIDEEETKAIRKRVGLKEDDFLAFEHFPEDSDEGKFLKARGEWVRKGMQQQLDLKKSNVKKFADAAAAEKALENFPTSLGINLKFVPLIHTQWMVGQLSAKLTRIAETPLDEKKLQEGQKPLTEEERRLKPLADGFISMAPDVGTSTNLNSTLDGRIFGPEGEDFEAVYQVQDSKSPHLAPTESEKSRFIRFDIAESNTMSCVGSYGKMAHYTGVPILPLMTVYDFFIKRALDQFFFNAYWKSSFICVGTPAGVSLSPEGAQHGWKSDIQIANTVTWEPAFCQELDWIFTESIRRHMVSIVEGEDSTNGVAGRNAVLIRCVTRALEQKEMLNRLKTHKRFEGKPDADILETTRKDCLEGGYYLVDHRGKDGYRPSENVVHIFTMGAMVTEALAASDKLLDEGIFANVIQVSSTDLLLGNQAQENNFRHLKQGLGITGDLYTHLSTQAEKGAKEAFNGNYPPQHIGPQPFDTLSASPAGAAQLLTLAGRRIPIVSVHDGEPGLLDNIGSCVGTLHKTLATRKHSKCGRPSDVYGYHSMNSDSVVTAVKEVMEESALSEIHIDANLAGAIANVQPPRPTA